VVPQREGGYTVRDTLRGRLKDRDVRVTFRHDTTWRVDTVTRWRTIYREGARVDTLFVRDPRARVDTVWVGGGRRPGQRVDTVRVVVHDTVRVPGPGGPGRPGTPGGPIIMPPPRPEAVVDTVRITIHDTVRVAVRDTVRITIHDTIRLPGHRVLHVPPGQYPPPGQCRVWIMDLAPGQQAAPAACNALGTIPAGAFILFRGNAWDFDYDWLGDPSAPPEIIALQRHGNPGSARPSPTRPLRFPTRRP